MKLATLLTLSVLALSTAAFAEDSTTAPATRAAREGRGRGRIAAAAKDMTPAQRLDARENIQQRRIQAGTAQGQLTPDEIAKLQTLETNIHTMETGFKSDGKLSKEETQKLREALNAASLQIWAQRHDSEGNQKPALRLGKTVVATDDLTKTLESPDLAKPQARQFLKDFRQLVNIKRRLAAGTDTPDERAKLQTRYTTLLNKYFTVKNP
jgi:hypothetical protein